MKKSLEIITKIILIMFAILLTIILLDAFIFYTPICYTFHPLILVIGVIVYLLLLVGIYKKVIPKIENKKWTPIILITIFLVLCLTISYLTRLQPKWDMGNIYAIVESNINSNIPFGQSEYLYLYPHNLMITIIWTIVLKIANFIHITDFVSVLTVINSVIVTLIVTFMYKIAKELGGKRKGILVLIIAIFTTPLYLHAAIYYTDAISALMVVAAFYIYLLMKKQDNWKKTILYQILFGVILWIRNGN